MSSKLIFDLQRFAHTTFNIATGNTVLSSSAVPVSVNQVTGTLPVSKGGTGATVLSAVTVGSATSANSATTATTASSLTTARALQVSLNKTSSTNFQGNANVTNIGVQGTLAIGNGGTGITSNPSMLTNLGTTAAANVFQASPRPGVTGTLPVANGGTGQTSLANVTGVGSALRVSRGTLTGTNADNLMHVQMADNDYFRIRVGATATNAGWVEFATADDSNEPIYVRQYQGNFTTITRTATLLDASGNTSFPGTVTAAAFSGTFTGNVSSAVTASSLATARALQVSLSNTSAANFQGNGDVKTIGVQGILAVANGGTGTNNLANITVGKANTLTTARALQVSLSSTGAPTFNGTADVKTIGVTGTLAIGNGGTGMTSNPSMLTNLGTTAAANVFQASPRPGVTGTLPVANGGTGTNNLSNVAVGAATKATQDGSGNTITTTYAPLALPATQNGAHQIPYAGNSNQTSATIHSFQSLKSGFYTETLSSYVPETSSSNSWYNVISVRHRNGGTDGTQFGMLVFSRMNQEGNLYWQQQVGGSWKNSKMIIDTSNIGSQTVASAGTCTGNAKTASSLVTARALQVSLSNTSAANFQGNGDVKTIGVQGTLAVGNGGTGTNNLANITVGKANTLTTARALQVSLSTSNAPTFNGTADVKNIGVTGTLGVGNGGTGATTTTGIFDAVKDGNTALTIQGSTVSNAWFKIAEITLNQSWGDATLVLSVKAIARSGNSGILVVHVSTNATTPDLGEIYWLINKGFNMSYFRIQVPTARTSPFVLWYKNPSANTGTRFTVLDCQKSRTVKQLGWTLYNSTSGGHQNTDPSGGTIYTSSLAGQVAEAKTVTDVYQRTAVGALDWANSAGNTDLLLQKGAVAYWNGAYSGSSSNLAYCNKGAFGSIVTCNSPLPVANGGTGQTSIANIQAGKDGNGSVISSTYLKLAGGTITGDVTLGTNSAPSHIIMPTVGAGIFSEYRDVRSGLTIIHKMNYGHDILLQGSNKAIVVAGECIQQMCDSNGNLSYLPDQGTNQTITANHNYEDVYIMADKDIFLCAGQDTNVGAAGQTFVGRLQAKTGYLRGLNGFEGHLIDLYGTTYTAAATGEKAVTLGGMIQDDNGAARFPYGMRIAVEFRYGNTASKVTLNVNNLGAKGVYYKGSETGFTNFKALVIYEFIYNLGNWYLVGDHG